MMEIKENLKISMGEADRVVLTTVMDNYSDVFLISSKVAGRWGPPDMVPGKSATYGHPAPLLAEHGFSLLIKAYKGDQVHTMLFDAGFTEMGVPHNLKKLGININTIELIVVSHGHPDHTAAIPQILKAAEKPIPVYTHPSAFLKRYLIFPDGSRVLSNTLSQGIIKEAGAEIKPTKNPVQITPFAVVTGEIDMVNDFELHFPLAYYEQDGKMEKDFFVDEKGLFINLKNKGLIIIAGCSHRGIINTIEYAKKISGIDQVHAVIGGFHLTGATPLEKVRRTVEEMKRIQPRFIIPTHCTGWNAIKTFADEMPHNFILNAVGTELLFNS